MARRTIYGLRRLAPVFAAVIAMGLSLLTVVPVRAGEAPGAPAGSQPAADGALDQLILKSGKVVEGRILEESASSVKIRVRVAGIEAVTSFLRADILEVKKGGGASALAASTAGATESAPAEARPAPKASESSSVDPSAARLYVVTLKGRFGFDISETPLKKIFEDADRTFGDTLPGQGVMKGKTIVDPSRREQDIIVLKMDCTSEPGFGGIFRTEELAPIVKEQIVDRGRRVIFWIEQARGGAAFLPWCSPEMYFTSDGKLGGIDDLDKFSSGDHMVDEKLVSAFLGHAEGFAIKGGYEAHIPALRAMLRAQNWLCVRIEGGQPVYLTRKPTAEDGDGWIVLSDDGKGENADKSSIKGNDTFLLESQWAEKLGISDGTADSEDDLAFRLGIQRNYVVLKEPEARGQKIMDDWKDRLEQALRQVNPEARPGLALGKLWREYREIGDQGDAEQRKKDRGRKIGLLKQVRGILTAFAEVLDPKGQYRAQIDTMLAQLSQQAEQENRSNRSGGDGAR